MDVIYAPIFLILRPLFITMGKVRDGLEGKLRQVFKPW